MSKFSILLNWPERYSYVNDVITPLIADAIGDIMMLGSRMVAGKVGERLSIQKVDSSTLPADVMAFGDWTKHHPATMRSEWAFMGDEIFLVVEKYFTGYYSYLGPELYYSPPFDFYRITGDDWSFCFTTKHDPTAEYRSYQNFYGRGMDAVECEIMVTGDFDAFETDTALYKLMGYFNRSE